MAKYSVTLTYTKVVDAPSADTAIAIAYGILNTSQNLDSEVTNLDVQSMIKMSRETKGAIKRGSPLTAGDYARQTAHFAFNAQPTLRVTNE